MPRATCPYSLGPTEYHTIVRTKYLRDTSPSVFSISDDGWEMRWPRVGRSARLGITDSDEAAVATA